MNSQKRRTFLGLAGVTGVTGLAGCLGLLDDTPTEAADDYQTTSSTREPFSGSQVVKLTASDGDGDDLFGEAVALADDGLTALVGAAGDDDPNGEEAGAAYLLRRVGGEWRSRIKIAATDGDSDDAFGTSVALASDGTSAIAGAPIDKPQGDTVSGSAYIYESKSGTWAPGGKLFPSTRDQTGLFGFSVALGGDGAFALVGAPLSDNASGDKAGSAYVFEREEQDTWNEQTKFLATDGDSDDWFGTAVALADDNATALIGAPFDEDPNGDNAGSAYVYERSGDEWNPQGKLTADDGSGDDNFGFEVDLTADGTTALVGARGASTPNGDHSGAAYVFERTGAAWTQQAKLHATDGDSEDLFGVSVELSGDGRAAIVGASLDEDPNGDGGGSAYVFERTGESDWTEKAKLVADDGDDEDTFGFSVALAGERLTALVGAPDDEDPYGESAGSAYVFE